MIKQIKLLKHSLNQISHLTRYQIGFETSTRFIDFIFGCVHLLHYKCHKTNFKPDDHM